MKLVRFLHEKKIKIGLIEGARITELKSSIFEAPSKSNRRVDLRNVKILPPVTPSKIIAVGLNYRDHAKELGMKLPKEPIIFMKPPSSIVGHKDAILYPNGVKRLDYEAELAFVIKKKAKNIAQDNAHDYILGYTCFNDVTARDLQKRDVQWTRAKSFDTFCPVGPFIETDIDPSNVGVRLYKNGILRQASNTKDIIFSPHKLLSFISRIMLLLPGDIIATGTPKGVGPMRVGDAVEVAIDGIGSLRNRVKKI